MLKLPVRNIRKEAGTQTGGSVKVVFNIIREGSKIIFLSRNNFLDCVTVILIFILSRLCFLFFTPYSLYVEEAKIGSIGHDILFGGGLRLPFWGYLDSPHAGGSIFSGLFAIPFYCIFGDKYLALKVAALFISILTLLFWYKLLASEINDRNKFLIPFLACFVFATPHFVQKSIILIGNTAELMFFNVLAISYFCKIKREAVTLPIKYFYLGIICGFSFWIQFMSFYLFLAIIFTFFISGPFRITTAKKFLFIVGGFMFGALPLWIYNILYKWATFTTDSRVGVRFMFALSKLRHFMFIDMPASFHFLDLGPVKGKLLGFMVYWLVLYAIVFHLVVNLANKQRQCSRFSENRKESIGLELFLILYVFIFILGTTLTRFPIGSNNALGWNSMNIHAEYYIVSLQPVIFALLILLNKYKIKCMVILNIWISVIFIFGYLSLFTLPYYNAAIWQPMHSTEANAYECGFNFVRNKSLFSEFFKEVPLELRNDYFAGAARARE
jgi:hypothetical protein